MHFNLNGKPCYEPAWFEGYAIFWCMCSELLNWSKADTLRNIGRCSHSNEQSIEAIISTLTTMDSFILSLWETKGKQLPWAEFKAQLSEKVEIRELIYIFKPVYTCVYLRRDDDYTVYRMMRSCLLFLSRITLNGNIEQLQSKVYADWKAVDASLPDNVPLEPKKFFTEYVCGWKLSSLRDIDARFSNGSCADAHNCLYEKYMQVGTDSRVRYLNDKCGIRVYRPDAAQGLCFNAKISAAKIHGYQRQLRVSLGTTVPKNYAKRRGINMEPAHLTALQQCVKTSLYSYIEGHPHLSKHICFSHAEYNAEQAQIASEFGYYATIDISSASDRISKTMLKCWMGGSDLYRAWLLTKSDAVAIPDGDGYEIWTPRRAFSMGSAVCFPIETLCYAALCETALEHVGIDPAVSAYRVYGDDIIIECQAATALVQLLEVCGCKVNMDKTYMGRGDHIFRESCGGEFLDGVDVTPVRISRRFTAEEPLKRFADFQELANRCYALFPGTRAALVNQVLEDGFLPHFTLSEEGGWCSYTASNFHLPILYDDDLQESFAYFDTTTCRFGHEQVSDLMYLQEVLRRMEVRTRGENPYRPKRLPAFERGEHLALIDADQIISGANLIWMTPTQEERALSLQLVRKPWAECRIGL